VHDGDRVRARWDLAARRLVLEPAQATGDARDARLRRKAVKPNGASADEVGRPEPRAAPDHAQPTA
jgi:hypothetical protein